VIRPLGVASLTGGPVPKRIKRFRAGANSKLGLCNHSVNLVTGNSNYLSIAGFMQLRSKKHIPVTNLQMLRK
jgi:hypothetical protein